MNEDMTRLMQRALEYGDHQRKCVVSTEMRGPTPITPSCDCGWQDFADELNATLRGVKFYENENHDQVLRLWNEMGWEQRNRERELGEIPKGADPEFEEDHYGLDDEQWEARDTFERNCSCHLNPPCSNCMEHSELFPEEY